MADKIVFWGIWIAAGVMTLIFLASMDSMEKARIERRAHCEQTGGTWGWTGRRIKGVKVHGCLTYRIEDQEG